MSGDRFKQCNTCGQRKEFSQFGLAATRLGRQHNCHDCVIELMKKCGTLDNYIAGKSSFHNRTVKGAFQDHLYYRQKAAIKSKKLNSDRIMYNITKKTERISRFKEMFPETS